MRFQSGQCLADICVVHRVASSQFTNLKPDLLREVWRPEVMDPRPAAAISVREYLKPEVTDPRLAAEICVIFR